jgi:hemerythrin
MSTQENRAAVAKVRDELTSEHAAVRALVERLRQPRATPEAAYGLLEELHGTLKSHFAHEEYPGGFYETMGACTAEHAEDLRVLVDQHYLILSAANSLKERARGATSPNEAFDRELRALTELIAGHERHEHKLAHDLGG